MTLHEKIMNLPAKYEGAGTPEGKAAYVVGFKDARHAAAELAQAREVELVDALKAIIEAWDEDEIGQIDGELIEAAREAVKL